MIIVFNFIILYAQNVKYVIYSFEYDYVYDYERLHVTIIIVFWFQHATMTNIKF